MPTNKSMTRTTALAVPALLLATLSLPASAGNKTYSDYGAGNIPMNSYGECWQAIDGLPATAACGGVVDSDGDGVPDDRDRCPGTPKGVKVDEQGCPPDADGDGVPDYKDQCPDTPRGAPVDAQGCPLDSDGDGVPDYRDRCPGTPAGAKVNKDGCEIVASITIDLVEDEFDFDSAVLKPNMKAALADVAAKVKASPGDERLLVIGHTDSVGPEDYNQGLSERRAEAAAGYLVDQGISADRVGTKGMGESQPVADNDTAAGRAKNRRVEIQTQ